MSENKIKLENVVVIPDKVKVREFCSISISFSINEDLPPDTILIFRLRGGRNNKNDWYFLQPHDDDSKGHVKLFTNPKVNIIPFILTGGELSVNYYIYDKNGLKKGSKLKFEIKNTLVQSIVEIKKKFEILIKYPGKKAIKIDNSPYITVENEEFDHLTAFCPSTFQVKENITLIIRAEDKYYNLVEKFSGKIDVFVHINGSNEIFLKSTEFKEEDKGFLKVNDISIKVEGYGCFILKYNDNCFKSNSFLVQRENPKHRLYWGFIHGHTNKSDGIRSPEEYFENMKKAGLNFGTTTEHDHSWETSDDDFNYIKSIVKKFHEDGEFVSFFGYEWGYWYVGYGDICIYYYDDSIPILRSDVNKYNSVPKLVKNLKRYGDKVLMINHHSALRPGYRNWNYFDNSLERLVEIYSTWGSQELPYLEGNYLPPRYKFFGYGKYTRKRGAILEKKGSFVRDALERGYKLGFTAGGDDHYGIYPSGPIDLDDGIYPPGIMAIWAQNLTKQALWKALRERRCYGSTGPRIIIKFQVEDFFMGEIIDLNEVPVLKSKRELKFSLLSSEIIQNVEIIRNNNLFKSLSVNGNHFEKSIVDSEDFEDIAKTHAFKKEKFMFYYLRVKFKDKNMAWASPIWIVRNLE